MINKFKILHKTIENTSLKLKNTLFLASMGKKALKSQVFKKFWDTVCKIIRCSFHIIFEHCYTTLNLYAVVKSPKIRLLSLAPKGNKIDPPSHTIFCLFAPPLPPPFGCNDEFGTPCIGLGEVPLKMVRSDQFLIGI